MQKDKTKQVTLEERGPIPSIRKPTIKKPSLGSFKAEHSPTPISLTPSTIPAKRPYTKAPTPKEQRSASAAALTQAGGSRRATINSLTAPAPVFDSRLPPPHADIKIPDPPSRSPTPPTKVIPQGRGNKYTPEDREFFIKFIQRALQKNPDLTRNELCEMVAERVSCHTRTYFLECSQNVLHRLLITLPNHGRHIGLLITTCQTRFSPRRADRNMPSPRMMMKKKAEPLEESVPNIVIQVQAGRKMMMRTTRRPHQ